MILDPLEEEPQLVRRLLEDHFAHGLRHVATVVEDLKGCGKEALEVEAPLDRVAPYCGHAGGEERADELGEDLDKGGPGVVGRELAGAVAQEPGHAVGGCKHKRQQKKKRKRERKRNRRRGYPAQSLETRICICCTSGQA